MAYQKMAFVYDRLMEDAPYDEWLTFTTKIFEQSGIEIQNVADLGCGTGEVTIRLAQAGYETLGIDYSGDMLTYAEQKSSASNLNVQWIHQDLRELTGLHNLDAAVSYCDVINYITSAEELREVFKRVADTLKTGGLFIFDVHSLEHVAKHLVNQTFTEVSEDVSYIWYCYEGDATGEMHHELTFFTLEDGKYNRLDEFHHQRTYSTKFYEQLLIESGFEKPTLYSDFSLKLNNIDEESERIFFVAKKGSR